MGALIGAPSYRQQHSSFCDRVGAIDVEATDVTTDPEEGRRQIEVMKPEPLKVGDKVRLKAGRREMRVFAVRDYGNVIECEWYEFNPGGLDPNKGYSYEELSGMSDVVRHHDTFPASALVRVDIQE